MPGRLARQMARLAIDAVRRPFALRCWRYLAAGCGDGGERAHAAT